MATSAAQHGSTGTGNDTGSLIIKFGPMSFQQGTFNVKLRHEGNPEAGVYNTILLHFVEEALKGPSFYLTIIHATNQELYKTYHATRKTQKERVADLGREQETIQAEIKRLSAARDRAFEAIGTDESAKHTGREQTRRDQQLENLSFDLDQRRAERKKTS